MSNVATIAVTNIATTIVIINIIAIIASSFVNHLCKNSKVTSRCAIRLVEICWLRNIRRWLLTSSSKVDITPTSLLGQPSLRKSYVLLLGYDNHPILVRDDNFQSFLHKIRISVQMRNETSVELRIIVLLELQLVNWNWCFFFPIKKWEITCM